MYVTIDDLKKIFGATNNNFYFLLLLLKKRIFGHFFLTAFEAFFRHPFLKW